MAHGFKPVDREQQYLLPPDVREWLSEDHLAWLVIDAVAALDLSELEAGYRLGGAGRQAYDPAMMVALLLYAYAVGVRSSRRIEQACETDVAFRVIAANLRPDHATIARFRASHQDAVEGLLVQVVGLCAKAGLVDPRLVAVDSTKLAANAAGTANVTREQLEELARQVLADAARIDAEEDARFGADRRGDELPAHLAPGPDRARRIRQALDQVDEQDHDRQQIQARQQARVAAGGKKRGRPPLPPDPDKPWRVASRRGAKARKANLTDPDSRTMHKPGGFVQGYTAQAVATAGQIILATDVTNDQNDNHALKPMLEQTIATLTATGLDDRIVGALADRGYWNPDDIHDIEHDLNVAVLVATVKASKLRAGDLEQPPEDSTMATMHRRLTHPTARRLYKRRSVMIEPIFGQRKTNRRLDRFLRRGLDAVRAEWTLEATAHNLTKLWRARTPATPAPTAA